MRDRATGELLAEISSGDAVFLPAAITQLNAVVAADGVGHAYDNVLVIRGCSP